MLPYYKKIRKLWTTSKSVQNGTMEISVTIWRRHYLTYLNFFIIWWTSSFESLIIRKQLWEIELQMVSAISFGWLADFGKTLTTNERSSQPVTFWQMVSTPGFNINQEPITRSVQLPYRDCETAFSQVSLILDQLQTSRLYEWLRGLTQAREFPTKFPNWDLSHSSKFGIFLGIL